MKNLKITAYLQDSRIAGTDCNFPLDSILQYQWFVENKPDLIFCSNPPDENLEHAPLPFEKRGEDKWYWSCSFNTEKPLGESIKYWHKRFDSQYAEQFVDFGKKSTKVNLTSGKYKAYRMPLVVYNFEKLVWFAHCEPEETIRLCQAVTAIGKKRSQGFGFVDRWEFEDWHSDWSDVDDKGNIMRPLPFNGVLIDGGKIMQCGLRPPYWHRESQEVCYVPG